MKPFKTGAYIIRLLPLFSTAGLADNLLAGGETRHLGRGSGPSLAPCPAFQLTFDSATQNTGSSFRIDLQSLENTISVDRSGQTWPDKTTVTLNITPEDRDGNHDETCVIEIQYSHKFRASRD